MKIHFMMIQCTSFSADTSTLRANIANVEVRCTLSLHSDTTSLYAETLTS